MKLNKKENINTKIANSKYIKYKLIQIRTINSKEKIIRNLLVIKNNMTHFRLLTTKYMSKYAQTQLVVFCFSFQFRKIEKPVIGTQSEIEREREREREKEK
jgi:hypothetical protein